VHVWTSQLIVKTAILNPPTIWQIQLVGCNSIDVLKGLSKDEPFLFPPPLSERPNRSLLTMTAWMGFIEDGFLKYVLFFFVFYNTDHPN